MKSGYVVELSIDPGGIRRGDVVVVASAEEVARVFEVERSSGALAAEFLAAGGRALVWVVQAGQVVARIDARPFLTGERVDRAALAAALPALVAPVVAPGQKLPYSPEGRQDGLIGSSYGTLGFGYTDLEGAGATPHLKKAFPRGAGKPKKP